MGDSVREMLEFLCRLCARTDKSCVNVFSSDGDKHFIQKKIRLCLPVIVEEQDEMPRQICLSCLNKLESTYEFYTTCIYAQSTIQRLLKAESLHDRDHVNKSGSESKEKDPTRFSLDQYLKRKIDPVDTGRSSKVQRTDSLEKDVRNNNVCVETTKSSDSQASTSVGNTNTAIVATNNSEFQCGSAVTGNSNSFVVATNTAELSCASSAETQRPKLRVKTTSELRQGGQTAIVTDCVSALLSLQNSSALSASVPTTRQSTCVSASPSTTVVFAQSAVPQISHTVSSLPLHVKNSSASKGGTSWSPLAQNAKSATSAVQLGKSSSAPQSIGSSPSVLQFSSSSSPVVQTATSSLPVPVMQKNSTVSVPVPKNTTASATVAKNATVSLSVPQKDTNSSSVQQYSLSVPSSLSSGRTILPKVSQFIIVPNTFASTPTFTAAGTNTVTVLGQALPSSVSVVGDLNVPLGSATTLVAPQSAVQALAGAATAAVPLASSSLPVVQTVPLQVTKQPSNPVMTSLTSTSAIISQSSTSDSVAYSVLNRNSQARVISSNSRVTASTANMFSKADAQPSMISQNLKVSSSSSVIPTGSAPAVRVGTEGNIVRLRSDTVVQGASNANSTVPLKQNGSAQLRTNIVAASRAVSHPNILPKTAAPVVTSAKNIVSNPSPLLLGLKTYSVPNRKKNSLVQPVKTSSETESTAKTNLLSDILSQGTSSQHSDSNKGSKKTVLCYSNKSASKVKCLPTNKSASAPTPVPLSQATVPTPVPPAQPTFSVSVVPAQQLKEGAGSVIVKKTYSKSAGNAQLPEVGVVSDVETESQLSDNRTLQRPQPSRGLPPPAVPLKSVGISESRKILAKTGCADLQNGQAASTSSGHQVSRENSQKQDMKNLEVPQESSQSSQDKKSGLTSNRRGPVATATVSPFNPTLQPASDPQRQSPEGPSAEEQVEPSSESQSAAEPGRSSTSSPPPPPAVEKEECPYCHVEFPADILIHHKTLHYREKFYTCIDCDKNFVTEKGLESHRCQKESKG